ncbi:MAG: extracellular solute-binding protein [Chloroflexi bacterium]|nr:extracellular solute-binding protein [Chloroflexota bacterium]
MVLLLGGRVRTLGWGLGAVLLLMAACGRGTPLPDPLVTQPAVIVATSTMTPSMPLEIASPAESQLVVWVPDFFEAKPDANAGNVLQAVYRQFEQTNPGVHVDVHIKAESGEASMFSYLRSAQRVAPTILPDLVLLDTQYLWQIAELDLVHPITFTELGQNANFYPFARNAVTFKQQPYGIPYTADLIHAVYDAQVFTTTPATWATVLAMKQPYLFPAGIHDSLYDESLLLQYVGAGGQLLESGEINNLDAAKALLAFLAQGKAGGVIPDKALNLSSLNAIWMAFAAKPMGIANVSASLYLSQPKLPDGLNFDVVPTLTGQDSTIARTWAFAILTTDPERRQLAFRLANGFLDPSIQGRWTQLANHLPTSAAAWATWTNTGPYQEFLGHQLEIATAIPAGRPFADFAKRLQAAQQNILHGQLSPEDAFVQLQAKP